MQMCGSTDRQVKSVQRNIFIHLYAKQIFSQTCSDELDRVAFVLFRPCSSERFHDTHRIQFTMYIYALHCPALSKEVHSGILSCVVHVFCELSSTQARKWRQGRPTGSNQSKSQRLFAFGLKKNKKTNLVVFDIQAAGMRAAYVCVHDIQSDLKELEFSQVDLEMDSHHQGERTALPPPEVLDLTLR